MKNNEEKYLIIEEFSKIFEVTTKTLKNSSNQGILKCVNKRKSPLIPHFIFVFQSHLEKKQ